MGYIEKTHSSSGRVPSEKGYRYYVDHLIPFPAKDDKINMIEDIVKEGYLEFEQIVQKSAEILSDITNYTSFILGPECLKHVSNNCKSLHCHQQQRLLFS